MNVFSRLWRFINRDSYTKLAGAVAGVAIIGTVGSIMGKHVWAPIPASSFGTTGAWVAGAAAVAAILAVRLESNERAVERAREDQRRDEEAARRDRETRCADVVALANQALRLAERVNRPTKVHTEDYPHQVQLETTLQQLATRTGIDELSLVSDLLDSGGHGVRIRPTPTGEGQVPAWEVLNSSLFKVLSTLRQIDITNPDALEQMTQTEPDARAHLAGVVRFVIEVRLLGDIERLAEEVMTSGVDRDALLREKMNEYLTRYQSWPGTADLYEVVDSILAGTISDDEARPRLHELVSARRLGPLNGPKC